MGDEIDFQKNRELSQWFEQSIRAIYSRDVAGVCVVAIDTDGAVLTGYYNADAQMKAIFAHNINADAMLDVVLNNIHMVRDALEDLEEEESEGDVNV